MRHEIDGFLVLPGDVPRLNAALDRLMGDGALRAQLPLWQWRRRKSFQWSELGKNSAGMSKYVCLDTKIEGETSGFHRTDVLRQCRFPMNVHGHVPEGVVWSAIATRVKTGFVNDPLRIVHFEPNSIGRFPFSAGLLADGLSLCQREILCNELRWLFYNPFWFLKTAAIYSRFHLDLHKTQPGKRWSPKGSARRLLVAMMWPIGALSFFVDRWKTGLG